MELDGQPALAALAADLQAEGGPASDVHVALPRTGSDTGDYLVRNLLGVTSSRDALVVGEHVAVGDPLMFCRRDADAAAAKIVLLLDGARRAAMGEAGCRTASLHTWDRLAEQVARVYEEVLAGAGRAPEGKAE